MTQPNTVSPRTYVPQDRLYVWAMVNPVAPTLVGEVGLSILEMLLFAGDDRFGALGISTSAEQYTPRYFRPYPQLADLAQLTAAVEDVQTQAPITAEIQRLIQPGVSLGGARPKALLQTDSGPCVIKNLSVNS